MGKYGYSFMIKSPVELVESEVIDIAKEYDLFLDADDRYYAVVDDMVTNYDIQAFGNNIIEVEC